MMQHRVGSVQFSPSSARYADLKLRANTLVPFRPVGRTADTSHPNVTMCKMKGFQFWRDRSLGMVIEKFGWFKV